MGRVAQSQMSDLSRELSGAERIAAERQRQVESEGWTPEHDDGHKRGEMAAAAACYAIPSYYRVGGQTLRMGDRPPQLWPWEHRYWRPGSRVRELEKAGALIAAEIDRLLRESSDA